jgi:hypothetical protein
MTPAQLHAPNALIPGSYESNAPAHEGADLARPVADDAPIAGLVLEGVRTAARLVYGLVWK